VVLFNGDSGSGDNVLSVLVFLVGWNVSAQLCFPLLNFFYNLKNLHPLQAFVAIGLISKNFCFVLDFYSPGKGGNKIFQFWDGMWRMGSRE
jgi:hypothetical protein